LQILAGGAFSDGCFCSIPGELKTAAIELFARIISM